MKKSIIYILIFIIIAITIGLYYFSNSTNNNPNLANLQNNIDNNDGDFDEKNIRMYLLSNDGEHYHSDNLDKYIEFLHQYGEPREGIGEYIADNSNKITYIKTYYFLKYNLTMDYYVMGGGKKYNFYEIHPAVYNWLINGSGS